MKTLLLPTTTGVNEVIPMHEALAVLESNGITFSIVGDVVDGMYYSEDLDEIVCEQLLPISSDMLSADMLATMFTQECILESDDYSAKLVAQNGDIWANFDKKVEYSLEDINEAIKIQTKLAKHFGGASRIGNYVWAWGNDNSVSSWTI